MPCFFMEKYISKTVKLDGFIAKEKNRLLKEMLASDKDYFFLVEDNCKVLDDKIYDIFIDISKKTGVECLNWARKDTNKKIDFDQDKYIEYYMDFPSSFVMFTRNSIETVGFFDESMPENTYQDMELAKRIGDAGLSTPFGKFASPKDIEQYFEITPAPEGYRNTSKLNDAMSYWEEKDGADFPIRLIEKPKFQML